MLIYLDNSLLDEDLSAKSYSAAISEIFRSYRLGYHAMYASGELIEMICNLNIDDKTIGAAKKLRSKFREMNSIIKSLSFRLIVKSGDGFIRKIDDKIWEVGLLRFEDDELPKAVILAEDIKDAALYEIAAEHYLLGFDDRKGGSVCVDKENGGGSNIKNVLNSRVRMRNKMVYSICDSDIDHPGGSSNSYSRGCKKISESSVNCITYHLTLKEREIENLIPFNLICESLGSDDSCLDVYNRATEINSYVDKVKYFWDFFDIKNGLFLSEAMIPSASHLLEVADNRGFCESSCDCRRHKICINKVSNVECGCILLHPLSGGLLDKVLNFLENTSKRSSVILCKSSFNGRGWFYVGREISDFGFSSGKIRL